VQHSRQTPASPLVRYGRLWRGVPRELGFLALTMPLALIALGILNGLFWGGVGTLIIFVGLFFILAALLVARAAGTVELVRLGWSGQPSIARPRWNPVDGGGFWRTTFGPFADGHYWLYLLHGLVVNPIVSIVSWTVTVIWVTTSIGGITYWLWGRSAEHRPGLFWWHLAPGGRLPHGVNPLIPGIGDEVLRFVFGLAFLATLPLVTRGLTLLHHAVARGLLAAWPSETLQREVADLDASRSSAVAAEDQALRRLERDIHDGPQQRLVRLQMDLASAGRRLADDPDAARTLIEEAGAQARDALEELRALSRGFAPPILQDRGLVAALESLAARSAVPTSFESTVGAGIRLTPELERSAYFVAAELLANATKHADATAAQLSLAVNEDRAGASRLELTLTDNGHGGASFVPGHGLSGINERVRGLRGILELESPAGGPTRVRVRLPLSTTPGDRPV